MNQNPQYGTYPQPPVQQMPQTSVQVPAAPAYAVSPVQQPYGGWQTPRWADPQKLQQKEMRKAASRLSWAVVASVPLSTVLSMIAGIFLGICGVNLALPEGMGISGMPSVVYYLLSAVVSFLTLVLPFTLFLVVGKRRLVDSILVEKTGFLNGILLAFAGLFLCIIMNIPANVISTLLEELGLNGASNTESMTVNSIWDILTLCLSVVLVAPLTEEFAFRGVTVAVMRRWGDWPAVIFSAIIFAFAHYSFQAMPVVFTGGFVMALLYVWTRNIWINIFVHFLNNLIATLPIIVEFYAGEEASIAVSNISMLAVMVLGVASIAILAARHFTGRHILSFRMQKGTPVRKKILWLFVNPGFIVYFVLFIVMAVVTLYAV